MINKTISIFLLMIIFCSQGVMSGTGGSKSGGSEEGRSGKLEKYGYDITDKQARQLAQLSKAELQKRLLQLEVLAERMKAFGRSIKVDFGECDPEDSDLRQSILKRLRIVNPEYKGLSDAKICFCESYVAQGHLLLQDFCYIRLYMKFPEYKDNPIVRESKMSAIQQCLMDQACRYTKKRFQEQSLRMKKFLVKQGRKKLSEEEFKTWLLETYTDDFMGPPQYNIGVAKSVEQFLSVKQKHDPDGCSGLNSDWLLEKYS